MASMPAVVVVAAGRGSRFGAATPKLAQGLHDSTVLGQTLRQALASQLPLVVVTIEPLVDLVRRSVAARDIVVVPEAGTPAGNGVGMGDSIAAGVAARPQSSGWLVLPGDMPLVRPSTLQAVARELALHPVVCAQYLGRRGHPVGFAAELYSELIALHGDEGARRLVARYPALELQLDDPGVLLDVDTPADLERLRASAAPAVELLRR
jgi:molybdenum cofactor cytidylyltransferase